MGSRDNKKTWASIPKLAGENGKDTDSTTNSGELESKDLPSDNKKESNSGVAGYFEIMESQDGVRGN